MRVGVTGANGVVGAALVRALIERGDEVVVLTRPSSDLRSLGALPVIVKYGDVCEPDSLGGVFEGCDWVFHLASVFAYWGISRQSLERIAVAGTRNVVAAAASAGARRLIVTSSSVTSGFSEAPEPRTEADRLDRGAASAYELSKVQQEEAALVSAAALGVELVFACPTLVVGSNDFRLGTSNAIIVNYLKDPFRATFLGGCNIVAAEDVAAGHLLLAEHGRAGARYLLGGENLTWHDLHRAISDLCGCTGPWLTLNHTAAFLLAAAAEAYAAVSGRAPAVTIEQARMVGRYYWYDHAKVSSLGYSPVGARLALAKALEWLIASEHINHFVKATIQLQRSGI